MIGHCWCENSLNPRHNSVGQLYGERQVVAEAKMGPMCLGSRPDRNLHNGALIEDFFGLQPGHLLKALRTHGLRG